jgi:BirA family biotin operon repressor/biotin-[acetyl-CoA-carboxylase] ligase
MSISWNIEIFGSLSSTQELVHEMAARGIDEGFVAQALTQTKGRGRHGNEWISPMGNLYMSFILRPECSPDRAGQLSFVLSVALSEAIDEFIDQKHDKSLKWPNDILIDNKKCAGILLESELTLDGKIEFIVAGIGVNILASPEEAIGIQEVAGDRQVAIHPFRDILLGKIDKYYSKWKKDGFEEIRKLWIKQAYGIGNKIEARVSDKTICGTFEEIDDSGTLIINTDDKKHKINAGEIFFR